MLMGLQKPTDDEEGGGVSSESSLPPGEKAEVRTEGKTTAQEVRD